MGWRYVFTATNATTSTSSIRSEDSEAVRNLLTENGFAWDPDQVEFKTGDVFSVPFLVAGQKGGKGSEVKIVEPIGDLNVKRMEGLSFVRLSRLIEMKIACGMSNLRRRHKKFADVVELIVVRDLDGLFARFLHKFIRSAFGELVKNTRSE